MKKNLKSVLALALCVLMLGALLCGCSAAGNGGSDKLILGTSADYAPFEFMYADKDGTMVYGGIDVSVAGYVADYMQKDLQVENMSFDYLLTSLAKGDYDMVIAAMEADDTRKQSADFSDPYYDDMPPMILVRAADSALYNSVESLAGKKVGAQSGTTKADILQNELKAADGVLLADVPSLVNELVYNKLDAVVLDGGVARKYAAENPELVVSDASSAFGEPAYYCIAVQKGDPKGLLPEINAAIAKMKAENKIDQFIADADALSGSAVEVTADAPDGSTAE